MVDTRTIFSKKFTITGGDFNSAGRASTRIKSILKEVGIDPSIIRRAAISAYEAEMNVVMYADRGVLSFSLTPQRITILVEDEGRGIENINLAMREGYSTASEQMREMGFGAGMGLPNIRRNADEFKVLSSAGKGTTVDIAINLEG